MTFVSKGSAFKPVSLPDKCSFLLHIIAKIVQWCPQEQVLVHPSMACFVTNYEWN
nr:cinnamate beta-D-glucosyltransferase-like [Ipomoea batatas]